LFEYLITKFFLKEKSTLGDGSAVITGILLAFNVPAGLPIWMMIVGAFVAIAIGKMTFGGLGKNPFNPALVGRVFLLISFPVEMTKWPKVNTFFGERVADTFSGGTPLAVLKEGLSQEGATVESIMSSSEMPSYLNLFIGQNAGSIGEVSALLLLLGGLYMLFRKIITWHIPLSFLGTVVVFSGILWLIDPTQYVNPLFHLVTGGMMLGIFYMATDMVTSPMNSKGMLIFGFGVGLITMIIRIWGAYPEGVSFAILFMNAFVPLLNRLKPKRFDD
jgi:electron transport complex protein RnfD